MSCKGEGKICGQVKTSYKYRLLNEVEVEMR